MFQGFISKFTKNNLVKVMVAVCITASVAFGQSGTLTGTSVTWALTGTAPNRVLTLGGTGAMPTNFQTNGATHPWWNYRAGIEKVVIQSGVSNIANFAFYQHTGLKEVEIPISVTSIGNYAFSGCTELTKIGLAGSSGVGILFLGNYSTIGDYAFSGCTKLTSVDIPNPVTSIGAYAFENCTGLTQFYSGGSNSQLDIIGMYAFQNCTNLTSVTIGKLVTSIGNSPAGESTAFIGCTKLEAITVVPDNTNYASDDDGVVFNKSKTTLRIYPNGKAGAYTIPEGVTSISGTAFNGCVELTSVTIPNSVRYNPNLNYLSQNAFNGCSKLTEINANESSTDFTSDGGVLFNKAKTALVLYPRGKEGDYTIPESVTSIGNYAFAYSPKLTSVEIPNSVKSIGYNAFERCTGLTSVTIPNSVNSSIGESAFYACSTLTTVTIGNSVTSIGSQAFYNCVLLKEVTIGNSVTSIRDYAFYRCSGLTSVEIPNSVKSIGGNAFYACTGLTSVTIPNSVTSIGTYAFNLCNKLTSVTIPASVTSIENSAFANCTGLKQIISRNATPQTINANVFQNVTAANVKLFVPADAVAAYKNKTVWSNFSTQTAAIPFTLGEDVKIAVGDEVDEAEFDEDAEYAGNKEVVYTSGNSAVVIENNIITAGAGNTVRITATLDGGYFSDVFEVAVIKGKVTKPVVTATNLVYNGSEKSAGIAENALYTITGVAKATNAGTHTAHVELKDKANYEWADGANENLPLHWTIAKATGVFGTPAAASATYSPALKLSDLNLPAGYVFNTPATALNAGNNQSFAATFTDPSGNYNAATGDIVVNVAKATPAHTAPTGLTATVGQTLANVSLAAHSGWSWMNSATAVGGIGEQTHKAKFTPTDVANYNVLTDIDVKVVVSAATPIREIQKSDGRTGIRLSKNVVSDKAEFEVILPSDKVLEMKVAIYDNTGNVVFEKTERGANVSWNLTNNAGRNVANGTYLIIVEAKGINGNYAYSAKVGVKK